MPYLDCDMERSRAVCRRLLHVRAVVQQQCHDVPMSLFGGDEEWGRPILVRGVDVGLSLEEGLHLTEISFGRCYQQRLIHRPHGQEHRHESEHRDQHLPLLDHVALLT